MINNSTIIVGNFGILVSRTDVTTAQKVNKKP